ncbi:MAG: glycosyltransferase family 2 protein [Acidobacteriaceae bacterium]|nr:glycosyltransferase family 2 protein [Acidobacteriaceae bacterium]
MSGSSARPGLVGVTIVTFNSARYIARCLDYALAQDYPHLQIVVVDNASTDGTPEILHRFEGRVSVIYNRENLGFAGGQNQAIAAVPDAEFILTLNPDLRLTPSFVTNLVAAAEADPSAGSICGKLLAMSPDFEIPSAKVFDSTGIYMTPNLRHLDRGSRIPDQGQYDRFEYVFGGTGAACLYRRKMIEDISVAGEFFDSDFFAYREDADVAWRAQLLGWKCLYTPLALGYHVRSVVPENRSSLPAVINMHSVKNRWLLRIKNMTGDLYRRYWRAITVRDAIVIGGCLLREFTSLRAFLIVFKCWNRTWAKRREIMQRRRATDVYIASWFSFEPVSYAAENSAAISMQRENPATP